jgi:hypothetical protein
MASDNFQFLLEPGLQEIYRDKDTGLPLSGGTIEYFRDVSRTEQKPVFKLSGTPADPIFIELPNPLPLTQIGSVSDGSGVDIKPYYLPINEDGTQDLYYVEVRDSSGILQFTREGWPQQIDTSEGGDLNDIENYVENGQFLMRRLYPVGVNGLLQQETTNVAFAGWIAVLSSGFTSQNTIQFDRFTEDLVQPESGPRYALRMAGTLPNPAESIKDLRKIYNRVNCFSGDTFTLQFEALTNNGVSLNVDLFYQKNYGTGGSPEVEELIGSVTILPNSWGKYRVTFTVNDDAGQSFGPENDDEFRLVWRINTAVSYDFSMTNVMMIIGSFDNDLTYPVTSDYQAISKTLAGSMELTQDDDDDIGNVLTISERSDTSSADTGQPIASLGWRPSVPTGTPLFWLTTVAPDGYYLMDGSTLDLVGPLPVQPEAIRLWNVIGNVGGRGVDSFYFDDSVINEIQYTSWLPGIVSSPDPHLSGQTINVINPGDPSTRAIIQVICTAATSITAGSFFELFAPSGRSTVYWFRKDGVGADPSAMFPTSLVKVIDITSGDNAEDVSNKLAAQGTTQFVIPNSNGMFFRGFDNGSGNDPDAALRTDPTGFDVVGDVIGSIQGDTLQNHQHIPAGSPFKTSGGSAHSLGNDTTLSTINHTGGVDTTGLGGGPAGRVSSETRPKNISFNMIIKN